MTSVAVSMMPPCYLGDCRSEVGRTSNDYFSGSFHSDADSSGISSSELSDVALTELMVSASSRCTVYHLSCLHSYIWA